VESVVKSAILNTTNGIVGDPTGFTVSGGGSTINALTSGLWANGSSYVNGDSITRIAAYLLAGSVLTLVNT
jgi:hypothetical protein